MLTPNTVRAAIYNKLLVSVNAGTLEYEVFDEDDITKTTTKTILRAQVIFDNVKFDESDPPPDEPWVRLAVRHLSRSQESLGQKGNRKFLVEALVMIQVFVPTEGNTMEGDAVAWAMAEVYDAENLIVQNHYRPAGPPPREPIGSISFRSASCAETEVEGKLWGLLVEIPFSYRSHQVDMSSFVKVKPCLA